MNVTSAVHCIKIKHLEGGGMLVKQHAVVVQAAGCRGTEWQSNFFKACWVDGAMRVRGADLEGRRVVRVQHRAALKACGICSVSLSPWHLSFFFSLSISSFDLLCSVRFTPAVCFPLRIIHSTLSKLWNEDWLEISLTKLTLYCLVFVLLFNHWANILKDKKVES